MRIALDRTSKQPLYRQIEKAVTKAVREGSLKVGHRLPSTRELAGDLGLNRMTVETAYAGLEAAGLIERRHGSGTYILETDGQCRRDATNEPQSWPSWQTELPHSGLGAIQTLGKEDCPRFDFSTGMGDPNLIPAVGFRRTMQAVIRKEGVSALGYESPQGNLGLRTSIAEILSAQGLVAKPEQILVTAGAQQAISLSVQGLLKPGSYVMVEEVTYDSALALFRMLGMKILPLPMDAQGIVVEKIEPLLQQHRPGLLYCMPNFQNPTSCVLPLKRRQLLVELAYRYNFPILEDDYVGELRYGGYALPALKTLDRHGCVLYTSTFSKMLMPGLRVGFLMAEGPVIEHLTRWKHRLEIANPSILQRALNSYISIGRYRRHVRKARSVYSQRLAAMIRAINCSFPQGTTMETPQGGLFLWLKLPGKLCTEEVRQKVRKARIAVAWGERFFSASDVDAQWLRLNFAANEIPVIEEGIRRLGRILKTKA